MKEILLSVHIEAQPEGGYLATSADLPELVAQGQTAAEAMENAKNVARRLVDSYLAHGEELPPALRLASPASGNVLIPLSLP